MNKSIIKKRILTGDTPTGKLHLGHYVGTLENRVKLQDEYEVFIVLADAHALSGQIQDFTNLNYSQVRENTLQVALDNLSVGLDHNKATIFVESEIPEIYELAAIFSMYVSHNRALRNPTIKDEIKMKGLGDLFSLGFINYPIYQAADILCVRADLVPVGEDQKAHLEQAREIARTFNMIKPGLFPMPEALIGRLGKLPGTDGSPKMSKSLNNAIYLSDSAKDVIGKVLGMYTDPKRIHGDEPGDVENNPVFIYLRAFAGRGQKDKVTEYESRYREGNVKDVEVKEFLVEVLEAFLTPIRKKRKEFENQPEVIDQILKEGTAKARQEAQKTLAAVKKAMKLSYFQ